MRLSPIFAIVVREYYLMRASIARIVPLFVWSAIDIVLWGFLTRFLSGLVPAGFNTVTVLLGAILLWNFLIRIMQGVSTTFLEDVWTRNFLNVFSSPITIAEYLSGLVISSIIMSIIGVIVMLSIATIGFGLPIFTFGALLVPFVLILFLFGIALGIAGSAIVLRLGSSAEWFIWPIPAVISPFVGVLYPLSILPPWMQAIGRILPPSYVFEGMRTVISGGGVSSASLLTGFILSVLSIFIACGFFVYVFRYVVRTGLLARFSAEST